MRLGWRTTGLAVFVIGSIHAACDVGSQGGGRDAPIVLFAKDYIVISTKGPVAPPLSVGSASAKGNLVSDDPAVLAVDTEGNLNALKNGRATVRNRMGVGALVVEVRTVSSLVVRPEEVRLATGGSSNVAVLGDGQPLPAEAVEWFVEQPAIATIEHGVLRAGYDAGATSVTAAYGGLQARLAVIVVEDSTSLVVSPPALILREGQLGKLEINRPVQAPVTWASSDPAMGEVQGSGIVRGLKPGRFEACAVLRTKRVCASVKVVK